ncbi:RNA polymerase sigma factor [Gryllotalpicola reticulitermitis]
MSETRLETAFGANAADLLRYLARRVPEAEDAADLLSETMETAWRKIGSLPAEPERARMWLFAIARNKLLHHGRARRRRSNAVDALRAALATHPPGDEHTTDVAIDVRRAVERLTPELAEIIRLIHWDGFTAADAAELLRIPAATARSRHARARELLAGELADLTTAANADSPA